MRTRALQQMRDMKMNRNYLRLEKEGKIPYIKSLTYKKWKKEASRRNPLLYEP